VIQAELFILNVLKVMQVILNQDIWLNSLKLGFPDSSSSNGSFVGKFELILLCVLHGVVANRVG